MKEMIYEDGTKHEPEILHEDIYKGYKFYIVSYGTHPCCYVEIPVTSPYYEKGYDDIPIFCHGGLTFSGERDFANFAWCIGWDFAHAGDQYGTRWENGHEWLTEELLDECISVIDQLVEGSPSKTAYDLSYTDIYDFTAASKEDKESFFNELYKDEEE